MFEEIKITLIFIGALVAMIAAFGVHEYREWERTIEEMDHQTTKELAREYQKEFTRKAIYACVFMVALALFLVSPLIIQVVDELCG